MAEKKAVKEAVKGAFKRTAALVVPSLSIKNIKEGESLFVKAASEIASKPALNDDGTQKLDKKGQPADLHLLRCVNLETGELGEMVLPFLVHKALSDQGGLVGRCFEFVKGREEKNKATLWTVFEIEE